MALKRFSVECSVIIPGIEAPDKPVIIYTPGNLQPLEEREYIEDVLAEKYIGYTWDSIAEEPFPVLESTGYSPTGLEGLVLTVTREGKDPVEMLQDLVTAIQDAGVECAVLNELERGYF